LADGLSNEKEFKEDSLLSKSVLWLIGQLHGSITSVKRHVEVGEDGLEVDAVVLAKRSRYRVIGVELKAFDVLKAVQQAVARRPFFHYFYIVIGEHSAQRYLGYYIDSLYRHGGLQLLMEHGIGWIMVDLIGNPWLIFPSRFMKTGKVLKPESLRENVFK
jgi:hypothetical protein